MSKGKFHSVSCHEGTEELYMQGSTLSLTLAPDGVGGQSHVPTSLPAG